MKSPSVNNSPTNVLTILSSPPGISVQYNLVYAKFMQVTSEIFTNKTGHFHVTSIQIKYYDLVLYD